MKKRLAIVGGGASGVSLAWLASTSARVRGDWEIVLLHDEPVLGGHSHSIPVALGGESWPVDIGVQVISPAVYPHAFAMISRPELRDRVPMVALPPMELTAAFTPEHNWTIDPRRVAREPRAFADVDAVALEHAREMTRDLAWCLARRVDGAPMAALSLDAYFARKPHLRDSAFFRFGLMPQLSIINGYTAHDLLETTLGDLFPIVCKLPGLPGLMPFDRAGSGWYRFARGSQSWIEAMADLARDAGVQFHVDAPVEAVEPSGGRVEVAWGDRSETFDAVVLTTDMTTNRAVLRGPGAERMAPYLAEDRFPLLPGVCLIHQDDTILAPHLEARTEAVQFTGTWAWRPEADNPYGLPYDLHATLATHLVHNTMPLPEPCYVSMYAEAQDTRWPDPDRVLHRKEWRHGRWMSSFFKEGKARLHEIQGLGGVWFAGNNTTFDSEEGAVLSAIGVAERLFDGFDNPLGGLRALRRPLGVVMRRHFVGSVMFPKTWSLPS